MSRITHDVPPYAIGAGVPFKYGGLNLIGLKRHGFPLKVRQELSKAFRLIFKSDMNLQEALQMTQHVCEPIDEIKHWIWFCKESKRGLIGLQEGSSQEESCLQLEDEDLNINKSFLNNFS